jgi:hypothetical protein
MAFLCNYQKFGSTFNDAYVRIERMNYVAKPEKVTTRPEPALGEDGVLVEPGPNEIVETFQTVKRCNLIVAIYHSEASREAAQAPIEIKHEYIFDVADGATLDLFDQGYSYLKTLPEFTGAVDA